MTLFSSAQHDYSDGTMQGRGILRDPPKSSVLARVAMLAAVLATTSPSASLACGYHDDVSLARGILNWVYPDALHVIGAISTAIADGRMPLRKSEPAAPNPLYGSGYRTTVRSMERLAEALRVASGGTSSPFSFSLVLVEPMLWTRLQGDQHAASTEVHVSGPRPGDAVIVSGEVVIGEIASGRLAFGDAHRLGLIRFYGSDGQLARFIELYGSIGRS